MDDIGEGILDQQQINSNQKEDSYDNEILF